MKKLRSPRAAPPLPRTRLPVPPVVALLRPPDPAEAAVRRRPVRPAPLRVARLPVPPVVATAARAPRVTIAVPAMTVGIEEIDPSERLVRP